MKKLKSNLATKAVNSVSKSSFILFFTKLPKLLLAELMFVLPLSISVGAFALIGTLLGFNNILIWGLGIIPTFPLYAGLTMIIRKISVEKADINIFKVFFTAVKDNFKRFLIHGLYTYAIISCSFFAILYYYSLAKTDITFGYILTLYVIFIFILICTLFYLPIMTVTYELKLSDIYKNSFLLVFGKILKNLITFALILIISAATFLAILYSEGVFLVISIALTILLYPLITSYITITLISKPLQDSVGSFVDIDDEFDSQEEAKIEQQAIENANATDDYVFVNGRMVKNTNKINSDNND